MPRGGKRLGAGRPFGSTVLDWFEVLTIAAECQKRWHADIASRLEAEREKLFSKSDYRELTYRNRLGLREFGDEWGDTFEGEDLADDIEGAIKMMADLDTASADGPPRVFSIRVPRPYGIRMKIIDEVAAWASEAFGKPVTSGLVKSAWAIQRRAEQDDV